MLLLMVMVRDSDQLVGLERQAPARVAQAVSHGGLCVGDAVGAVHRLEPEMAEGKLLEHLGREFRLGIDQLEFCTFSLHECTARFGTDADPVDSCGAAMVPLVSTAISKPLAFTAAIRASSSWSRGSPPVKTT